MATFQQGSPNNIPTALPSTAPIETPVNNMTAAAISAVGTLATEGYKMDVKSDSRSDFEGLLKQYDKDIQASEDSENFAAYAEKQMDTLVAGNPELASLRKELTNLSEAEYQRTVPTLLLQLRGEAAMKKAIRRAPGLRKEIASIANQTLSFDPSGATVRAIMRGLEAKPDGTDDMSWMQKEVAKDYQSTFGDYMITPEGQPDYAGMGNALRGLRTSERTFENTQRSVEQGQIAEQDGVTASISSMSEMLGQHSRPALIATQNILQGIQSYEEFERVKPQLMAQWENYKNSANLWIDNKASEIQVSGANAQFKQDRIDDFKSQAFAGIESILNSSSSTEYENNLKMYDYLTKDLKMNFSKANTTLASIQANMPGLMQQGFPALLSSDLEMQRTLKNLISKGFTDATPEQAKELSLQNMVASLQSNQNFQNLSAEERKEVAVNNAKHLKEVLKTYDGGKLSQYDLDALGNSYATVAQTLDTQNSEDVANVIELLADPKLTDIINQMQTSGLSDNVISAEILADSNIEALTNYMNEGLIASINNLDLPTKGTKVIYNMDEGTFSFTDDWRVEQNTGNFREVQARMYRYKNEVLNKGNKVVRAIGSLKDHDPSISGLSTNQMSQRLFLSSLRRAGVQVVGTAEDMPTQAPTAAESARIDRDQVVRDLEKQIEELTLQLQNETINKES